MSWSPLSNQKTLIWGERKLQIGYQQQEQYKK